MTTLTLSLGAGPRPSLGAPTALRATLHLPSIHAPAADAPAGADSDDATAQEQILFRLIRDHPDQQRRELRWDAALQHVARLRCADMLNRQYFGHVTPDGNGPNAILIAAGLHLPDHYSRDRTANNVESIATNSADAAAVAAGFFRSPPHRAHLLGENSFYRGQTRAGVGHLRVAAYDPDRLWVMWVVLTLG